jgi:hypothetical protein
LRLASPAVLVNFGVVFCVPSHAVVAVGDAMCPSSVGALGHIIRHAPPFFGQHAPMPSIIPHEGLSNCKQHITLPTLRARNLGRVFAYRTRDPVRGICFLGNLLNR